MRRSARSTRASRTAPTAGRRSLPVVTQAISDSDGDDSDSSEEMPTLPQRSPVIKLTAATGAATIGNKSKQPAPHTDDDKKHKVNCTTCDNYIELLSIINIVVARFCNANMKHRNEKF